MKKETRILKIGAQGQDDLILEAAGTIKEGGIVAFPTETVYGLGADALNHQAVLKIFDAKGRPADNPLIVHVDSKQTCMKIARNIPDKALFLMEMFWPGPLTLILERKDIVPDVTTAGLDTVAVRIPENIVALKLIEYSGTPIAAPSANLSGKPSPTNAEHVLNDLYGKVDVVLDGGEVNIGVESTVLDMTSDVPALLRPGKISKEDIELCVGDIIVAYDDRICPETERVRSPGMKYIHYSPDSSVILVEGDHDRVVTRIKELVDDFALRDAKIGLLLTDETKKNINSSLSYSLGSKDFPEHAAKNLFLGFRYLDGKGIDVLIVDGSFKHEGIGMAVFNRIRKAADMIIKV